MAQDVAVQIIKGIAVLSVGLVLAMIWEGLKKK